MNWWHLCQINCDVQGPTKLLRRFDMNNKTGAFGFPRSPSGTQRLKPGSNLKRCWGGGRAIDEQMASPKESVFSKWGAVFWDGLSFPTEEACNAWQLERAAALITLHCVFTPFGPLKETRRQQRGALQRVAELICMRAFIIRR